MILFIAVAYSLLQTFECTVYQYHSRAGSPVMSEFMDASVGHSPYSSSPNSPQDYRSLQNSPVPLPDAHDPYPEIDYHLLRESLQEPHSIQSGVDFIEWTLDSCYCPSCTSSGFIKLNVECKHLLQNNTEDGSFDELFRIPDFLQKAETAPLSEKDGAIINNMFADIINKTQNNGLSTCTLVPFVKTTNKIYSIQALTILLSGANLNMFGNFGLKNGYEYIDVALHEAVKTKNISEMHRIFELTMKFASHNPSYKPTLYTSQYCSFILFAESQKMERTHENVNRLSVWFKWYYVLIYRRCKVSTMMILNSMNIILSLLDIRVAIKNIATINQIDRATLFALINGMIRNSNNASDYGCILQIFVRNLHTIGEKQQILLYKNLYSVLFRSLAGNRLNSAIEIIIIILKQNIEFRKQIKHISFVIQALIKYDTRRVFEHFFSFLVASIFADKLPNVVTDLELYVWIMTADVNIYRNPLRAFRAHRMLINRDSAYADKPEIQKLYLNAALLFGNNSKWKVSASKRSTVLNEIDKWNNTFDTSLRLLINRVFEQLGIEERYI